MSFRKNIITTYAAQIISVLCSFLCAIMGARMLGAFGQGELALYTNFILLSSLLLGAGLPVGIVHFIAARKIEQKQVLSILLTVLLIGFALLLLALSILQQTALLSTFIPTLFHHNSVWFWLMLLHLLLVLLNIFLSSILQAEALFGKASYILISGSITLLLLYALRYFAITGIHIPPFNWILLALISSQLIQLIFFLRQVYTTNPDYLHLEQIQIGAIRPLIQFAFLAFMTNLIQFLSYKMDIWFVNYFHGKQLTGIYALGVSLAQMVWLLPSAIQSVLYAFISTHTDRQLIIQRTIKTTRQIAVYAISAGITGYLLSIYLVPILFGEEFRESVQCIGLLFIGVVPFCLSMAVSGYFAGTGRVRINLYSAILGFIVCMAADLLLIPSYGILGAAIASSISYISTVTFLLVKFHRD
ncbi:MAG: polysaccharide biosynthesis C-terminal domain-containing protein [Chitinophagaceae bacterium]|nr:polysaccharide biosynthesis C-terminal domain-containing protein [Chitinophagaceae bacterium]